MWAARIVASGWVKTKKGGVAKPEVTYHIIKSSWWRLDAVTCSTRVELSWMSKHTAPHYCAHSVCWYQQTLNFHSYFQFDQPLIFSAAFFIACQPKTNSWNLLVIPQSTDAMEEDFQKFRASPIYKWQAKTWRKKQFTLIPYQSVEMTEGTPEVQ